MRTSALLNCGGQPQRYLFLQDRKAGGHGNGAFGGLKDIHVQTTCFAQATSLAKTCDATYGTVGRMEHITYLDA